MKKTDPTEIDILFAKYIFKSWDAIISVVVQTIALIILYLIFENIVEYKLNLYWVKLIDSQETIGSLGLVSILSFVLGLIYILYQVRARNFTLKPWEILVILFYIKYRFFDTEWIFYPYDYQVKFFDSVPVTLLLPKIISVVWFYFDLEGYHSKPGIIDLDLPLNNSNPIDQLRRAKFASELVSVLKGTRPSEKALVIGINGAWGSGKSSLVYLIREALHKEENAKSFYEIVFNPWLYSQDKSLAQSFLNTIKQTIKKDEYIMSSTINSYAKTLIHSTESILLNTRFLKDLRTERTIDEELMNVKSRINDLKKTLMVIIDDLDRLSKLELLEVFRLIRLVADFPNTIYIVLYDKAFVKNAVKDELNYYNADIYIDKIVQVEYSIPESNIENIQQLFLNHLSKSMIRGIPESRKLWTDEQINSLIKLDIFSDCIKNIRDIKRFTNNFLLRYKSII